MVVPKDRYNAKLDGPLLVQACEGEVLELKSQLAAIATCLANKDAKVGEGGAGQQGREGATCREWLGLGSAILLCIRSWGLSCQRMAPASWHALSAGAAKQQQRAKEGC